MDGSGGNKVLGGDFEDDQKYIAPTVLSDVKFTDPIMQGEVRTSCCWSILFALTTGQMYREYENTDWCFERGCSGICWKAV